MDSLKPGESRPVTVTTSSVPEEVTAGSYWLTVFTDGLQKIDESDEYNNIGSSDPNKFTVTTPPTHPPAVASVTIDSVKTTFLGRDYPGPTGRDRFDLEVSGTVGGPVDAIFRVTLPRWTMLVTGQRGRHTLWIIFQYNAKATLQNRLNGRVLLKES